ncbi:MAG: hypothetical protein CO021_06095 [Deltaproteobacteria bacterium CG_4_9_14_0_2_um_filter_42_21]|nr:MAG: hypothetical protein CO021_06095 [Deltaproteobacteria bacterium CG_4_9_14_0_2_um_filter_42_21]
MVCQYNFGKNYTGGIASEIYGGGFGKGFIYGAATAAAGTIFNDLFHRTWDSAKESFERHQKLAAANSGSEKSSASPSDYIGLAGKSTDAFGSMVFKTGVGNIVTRVGGSALGVFAD